MKPRQRTKIATLTFKREELLYDIGSYAYVEGDVMRTDDDHSRHQVIDITQDGNVDLVTRTLNLVHSECVEMMYPYTKIPCEKEESRDDQLQDASEYTIRLLVPDDFSKTTVTLLSNLVHEYMVCRVLADWMKLTNPQSTADWQGKSEELSNKIRCCLNARCGRVRRTLTPF